MEKIKFVPQLFTFFIENYFNKLKFSKESFYLAIFSSLSFPRSPFFLTSPSLPRRPFLAVLSFLPCRLYLAVLSSPSFPRCTFFPFFAVLTSPSLRRRPFLAVLSFSSFLFFAYGPICNVM